MVYVLLADGFEEVEALTPIDYMCRAGIRVETLGVTGTSVRGAHGITVTADKPLSAADAAEADMVLLPGGAGYTHIEQSAEAVKLIREAAERGAFLAAICAAPTILGRLGYLDGKNATCFPSMAGELRCGTYTGKPVEIADRVITGRAAGNAGVFAFACIAALCGKETADRIAGEVKYEW